ncbi:MAG: hypothetical protein P1R58_10170 [bacterium]|nr:hypothetical protein [bacterium]
MLKKIILIFVVLFVVLIGGVYFARNYLAETAVEKAGTYALGVETNLGSASLELGGGSFEMTDYKIDNPEGFESDYFFVLDHAMLDVNTGSVLDDEVEVDSFVIAGAKIRLEVIDSRANFKVLMDHLNQLDFGEESSEEARFKIGEINVRDVGVAISVNLMGKKQLDKEFTLDAFTLRNVGGDNGATVKEITSTVMKAIITRASKSAQSFGLNVDVDQLKQEAKEKVVDEASKQLKELGGSLLKGGK